MPVQVSQAEFMAFLLTELGLVSSPEISNILRLFDSLDTDKSGVLTRDDIRLQLKRISAPPRQRQLTDPEE